jgi:hemin uptake protein HemP
VVPDRPNDIEKADTAQPAGKSLRMISSSDLLGGDRLVIIRHAGENYRLQVTATGKLILTK